MALAGCVGGPVFNLMLGVRMGRLHQGLVASPVVLEPLDRHAIVSLLTLFVSLPATYMVLVQHQYRFPRSLGVQLLTLYDVFTLVNVVLVVI